MIMVTNFQCDDDLMLHSTLNRSTTTVSQFLYHYTLQDLADAPISEICHDRCNELQRDDDLILHSALNISTSTFSLFFYHYTLRDLADAPNSEIDHDHGNKFST